MEKFHPGDCNAQQIDCKLHECFHMTYSMFPSRRGETGESISLSCSQLHSFPPITAYNAPINCIFFFSPLKQTSHLPWVITGYIMVVSCVTIYERTTFAFLNMHAAFSRKNTLQDFSSRAVLFHTIKLDLRVRVGQKGMRKCFSNGNLLCLWWILANLAASGG